jgi:tripartite-type tricarboxylate transporter receptor subunit TctC
MTGAQIRTAGSPRSSRSSRLGLKAPDVRASFAKLSIEPKTGTPGEFAAFIAEGVPKWAEMARISGIKVAQ